MKRNAKTKHKNEALSERMLVALSPKEKEMLQLRASNLGMSMSRYLILRAVYDKKF
jgi:DNA-binding CsgD family transcriptional regulator